MQERKGEIMSSFGVAFETKHATQINKYKDRLILSLRTTIWMFMILLAFFILCNVASAETESPKKIWMDVLNSFKTIKSPNYGKGTALVSINAPKESRVVMTEFEFKDKLSRSERFSINNNGEKGEREITWSQGLEYSVIYNPVNIKLEQTPAKEFYRNVGYDFHPDAFLQWRHYPISERLEEFINGPGVLSVKKDPNGILNLIGRYEDQEQRHYRVSSFDPSKGYRPVFIHDSIEFLNDPKKSINDTYTINWAKYGPVWYIKSARIDSKYWVKDINIPAKLSIEVIIQEFDPNVITDDNDFTLEGLGIPKGTRVIDKINERSYKYGEQ